MTVRSVTPEDAESLIRGFAQLSKQSRMFRFLSTAARLTPADVDGFTTPDHSLHIALGAVLHGAAGNAPAGIAHVYRGPADMGRAELALTVLDTHHRKGIGTLLLGRIMDEARRRGIDRLDALVHGQNLGMIALMRGLGATEHDTGSERHFVVPVHDDPAAYGRGSIARAVRNSIQLRPD